MRIRALYIGPTFSFGKKELIEYAIVNEADKELDVVVLSNAPRNGTKRFADMEKGWIERPEWEVRDRLLIITGSPKRAMNTGIMKFERVRVEKEIPIAKIVEQLKKKAEEITGKEEEGISEGENEVEVDGLKFTIVRYGGVDSQIEVEKTILGLYNWITASRRRVFLAAPAFIGLLVKDEIQWYAVALPKVLHFVRDNPASLVLAGIIDPDGFKAPYIVVEGMSIYDLGDFDKQRENVDWLDSRLGQSGVRFSLTGGMSGGAAPEETSPI